MSDTQTLLFANEIFYRAFADRDLMVMQTLWANHVPVSCIHPGWGPLHGHDAVMNAWQAILTGPKPPDIECLSPHPQVFGDIGLVICYERIGGDYLVATNIFVRRGPTWALVHHQAGPSGDPPPREETSPPSASSIN